MQKEKWCLLWLEWLVRLLNIWLSCESLQQQYPTFPPYQFLLIMVYVLMWQRNIAYALWQHVCSLSDSLFTRISCVWFAEQAKLELGLHPLAYKHQYQHGCLITKLIPPPLLLMELLQWQASCIWYVELAASYQYHKRTSWLHKD